MLHHILLEVEVYTEDNITYCFIANNGSSGVQYVVNSVKDVAKCVQDYLDNCEEVE